MPTHTDCPRQVPHLPHSWRETGGRRRTFLCGGQHGRPPAGLDVRLRPGALGPDQLARYGWRSLRHASLSCGLSAHTLKRVVDGKINPEGKVIAALMFGTGHAFDALFTVTGTDRTEPPLPVGAPG